MSAPTPSPIASTPSTAERLAEIHATLTKLSSSPHSHDLIELVMATLMSVDLSIQEDSPLVWLLIAGAPSTGKTETVIAARGAPRTSFLDKLTPQSFVSGAIHPKTGKRAKSLLSELDGKGLVVKDMTTFLSQHHSVVRSLLGDLQSIYDGTFAKAIGTAFEDSHSAAVSFSSRFALVGCVTPGAMEKHHHYLAQLGSRFLTYLVPPLTAAQQAAGFALQAQPDRAALRTALRALVAAHVEACRNDVAAVTTIPPGYAACLHRLARLVAIGRTPRRYEGEWGRRERVLGDEEAPFRVNDQLRTLLRCLTALHGRTHPTPAELETVRRVAVSSLLLDRAQVLAVLRRAPIVRERTETFVVDNDAETLTIQEWGVTAGRVAAELRLSHDMASRRLEELALLGLLVRRGALTGHRVGAPPAFYAVAPRFEDAVVHGFEATLGLYGMALDDDEDDAGINS